MNFKYQFIYFTMISYFKTNPKQKYFKCYKCYNIIYKFHIHKIKTRATHYHTTNENQLVEKMN
jgi:hypothetical protein